MIGVSKFVFFKHKSGFVGVGSRWSYGEVNVTPYQTCGFLIDPSLDFYYSFVSIYDLNSNPDHEFNQCIIKKIIFLI